MMRRRGKERERERERNDRREREREKEREERKRERKAVARHHHPPSLYFFDSETEFRNSFSVRRRGAGVLGLAGCWVSSRF